ncbi:hypothetical protein LMJF_07_0715 [Leishmania major strain Friedlin]|uniref:Uncharacterized protein n=1 Tax=Leishmania major TaxID=5664 RepID=E9ACQ2_LEIMA|nr:hypothetical protein LMJF_07_0715 [Leishmania major strain Friedlin]CAG9569010.1 hypothetical_protein_-_conserved [Leishmania major strain Friedlin]CBZ05783.1 hypothetical protein LMJF_07_0715 [Leishmania major strain Friedlin]|eukprot:XP_003721777.1 hypothetical protein LMJF_07_0715 [Leishmania major strain Friedlin]
MESASDACREQVRRIQAALLRLGWHQRTGDRGAFLNTPVHSTANPSDPLTASPVVTMQSALATAEARAGGEAAEVTSPPKSIARAPPTSAPPGVLGDHDVNWSACERCRDCLMSPPASRGAVHGSTRLCLQALQRHHNSSARAAAPSIHRTTKPHTFVRVVCDGERGSAPAAADVLACPSSDSLPLPSAGRVAVAHAFDDLIARAWGRAEVATAGGAGGVGGGCTTTTAPHSGVGRHWGCEGCAAPPDAAPSCTAEVRPPAASPGRAATPSDVSASVSSMLPFTATQPPPSTQLHDDGRSSRYQTSRLGAPTTRIASLVGADAASCFSTRVDLSKDALYAEVCPSATASHALPPPPSPRHALAASQLQRRMLRAVQLLDAALHSSSDGSSGGAATRRLDNLHQILMTLTDSCGQPLALPSRATGAALRRLRKRLVQELLLGNQAPGMLRRSSTSSRMPSRPSRSPARHAAIHDGLEGIRDEANARSGGTFSLENVADDVRRANPPPFPASDASSVCFAGTRSDMPAPTAVAAPPPALPPSPPPSSALDPYTESQQRFQHEVATLHQAQQRRLQLQRQRTHALESTRASVQR